jgi:hypothetical protein
MLRQQLTLPAGKGKLELVLAIFLRAGRLIIKMHLAPEIVF